MKYFQIVLDDDLYDEWIRYWGAHGLRQFVLRRVVRMMVDRARKRNGLPPLSIIPPRGRTPIQEGTLSEQLNQLITEELQIKIEELEEDL